MIQGYAIYLRTHRATGKQYGGLVWWTKPNGSAEKSCTRRWKTEDRDGIRTLFGGFDSKIILSEKRETSPPMSEGMYRIRMLVDEDTAVTGIPKERRLNLMLPLAQINHASIREDCTRIGGLLTGRANGLRNKESRIGIFAVEYDKGAGGRIGGASNRTSGHIQRIGTDAGRRKACAAGVITRLAQDPDYMAKMQAMRDPEERRQTASKVGRQNAASGHLRRISAIQSPAKTAWIQSLGRRNVESGHIARLALNRFLKTVAWG